MKAVIKIIYSFKYVLKPISLLAGTSFFPTAHHPFQLNALTFPLKKKKKVLPEHLVQTVFHRLYKEPDFDFVQLCKIQTTQESQLGSRGWLDYSRGSFLGWALAETALRYQTGTSMGTCQGSLLQSYRIYLTPVKHELSFAMPESFLFSTWLLRYVLSRHHIWWGDDGRLPRVTAAKVQGPGLESKRRRSAPRLVPLRPWAIRS